MSTTPTITLTPNRRDVSRHIRMVRYDRVAVDRVRPVLVEIDGGIDGPARARELDWGEIRALPSVDGEFQRAWSAHVRAEEARLEALRPETEARWRASEGRQRRAP